MKSEEQNLRIEFMALDLKEERLKSDLIEIRRRKRIIAEKFANKNFELTLEEIVQCK